MTTTEVSNDIDLIQKLRSILKLAQSEQAPYRDRWRRNYNLVMNRPNTGNRISPQALLGTRSSEIFPILSNINAWMNDQHTTIDISAAADPNSPFSEFVQTIAQDLSTVIETSWEVENYDSPKKLAIWDALIYGTGYIKTVWDQSLAGGLGNAKIVHRSPFNVFIDPNASSIYNAEYVIEMSKMSMDEIERRYPGKSIIVEAANGGGPIGDIGEKPTMSSEGGSRSPKANPGLLQGAQTRWGTVSEGPKDRNFLLAPVFVYEFWLRENYEWEEDTRNNNVEPPAGLTTKHVRDRWRIIVLAANNILLDEYAEDLWTSSSHPYDEFKFEDVGELYGVSLVDHLANPQIALNQLLQALQKNAELTGNPIWIEPSNSGLSRTGVVNKPGQRLTVNAQAMQGGSGGGPRWLTPPEPSKATFDLIKFYLERMMAIAGLAAIEADMDKGQGKSADAAQMQQDVGFVRIRNALSNLENSLKSAGNKLCDLIIDNYTEARYIAITGPTGEKTALSLRARHFNVPTEKGAAPLKYTLNITAGSALPTSRQARAAQANFAYGVGIIDRIAWYQANQYPNWQAINQRITQGMKDGTFQPPGARQRRSKSGGSSQSQ